MGGDAGGVLDGLGDVGFGFLDGLGEGSSFREVGGDGGGVGAACAVGVDAADVGGGEEVFVAAVVVDVDGLFEAAEVAAFEEDGAVTLGVALAGGLAEVFWCC